MTLNKLINKAKTHYEDLLEYHIRKGVVTFDDLLLKDKKEVTFAFLKTLSKSDQEEVIDEAYAQISSQIAKNMIGIIGHPNERFDYSSELMDQWTVAIMDESSSRIDDDIETLEALFDASDLDNEKYLREINERLRQL